MRPRCLIKEKEREVPNQIKLILVSIFRKVHSYLWGTEFIQLQYEVLLQFLYSFLKNHLCWAQTLPLTQFSKKWVSNPKGRYGKGMWMDEWLRTNRSLPLGTISLI